MILFDSDIRMGLRDGSIIIDPFISEHLGTNSYDVRLADKLLVYEVPGKNVGMPLYLARNWCLDMRKQNPTIEMTIPASGMVLEPGMLYLGSTIEKVGTRRQFVPHIEGRSSVGRLGMAIHVTAGFGDCGFIGVWTMEITVVHPLRVYAGERVAQAYFIEGKGIPEKIYDGKYDGFDGPVASRMAQDKR